MTSIFGTISAIMIILQTVGIFLIDLYDVFRIEGGMAFFIKLILIIASAVPYITLWIAAHNHDRLKRIENTLSIVSRNTTPKREVKSSSGTVPTSNSKATLIKQNVGKDWTCPKCGEHNSNTAMSCKNCGEYK